MIRALSPRRTPDHPLIFDPIRCELWRGDVLESVHEVHAALVDERGQLLASAGDPHLVTTARSSLKPFQLLPTLIRGGRERFGLSLADLALMCASHNGELKHTERCAQLLDLRIGQEAGLHLARFRYLEFRLKGIPATVTDTNDVVHSCVRARRMCLFIVRPPLREHFLHGLCECQF